MPFQSDPGVPADELEVHPEMMRRFGWVALLAWGAAEPAAQETPAPIGKKIEGRQMLRDLRGNRRSLSDIKDVEAIVVAFLGANCPISNLYVGRDDERLGAVRPRKGEFEMKPIAIAFLLPLAAHAQDPQKTYDLKFRWKPTVGHKLEHGETRVHTTKVLVKNGEEVLNEVNQRQERALSAAVEILKVENEKAAESTWTFSKAERLEEGKLVPYGFQGKTVRVTRKPDGGYEFIYGDDSKPAEADLAALQETVWSDDRKDRPAAEELLAPKTPVKVGESWQPGVKEVVQAMMSHLSESIDLAKSTVVFTLKSVENRGGIEFGRIQGTLDLLFAKMGPMSLDKPVPLKLVVTIDACLDRTVPDGTVLMKFEMKGTSPVTANGVALTVDIDMNGQFVKVRKTAKKE